MRQAQDISTISDTMSTVSGEFSDLNGERFYVIRNVDRMPPFFVSVVSNVDHWLFASSAGGLTAGRVSPETALFPYVTVDKIHECSGHTGNKTLLRVNRDGQTTIWEPFKLERGLQFSTTRNLYKSQLGHKICFEEINHDLNLGFRYTWMSSDTHGFVRHCELLNLSNRAIGVDLIDGLQNILPAGAPRFAQTNTSNLVDAYKWSELDEATGMASFTLYSGITDRAVPCESLRANTVFCLGLDGPTVMISSDQLNDFRLGRPITTEHQRRGIRGAYMVSTTLQLEPDRPEQWSMVADVENDQREVVALLDELEDKDALSQTIQSSIRRGGEELSRIMASADAFQDVSEEAVAEHHYANVLFNVLRGGTFDDQYTVSKPDFNATIQHFNTPVAKRNESLLEGLPEKIEFGDLIQRIQAGGDAQLLRLSSEYLPIFFGRRHGDPSRPWNEFAIKVLDDDDNRLLSYQGNWRDIFQNWEALALSFPQFVESMIAKFVNASTIDGYNPYRITKEGIDWEVEEPDNPWSYIGYWGDHQIIYLQKLLEISQNFHPAQLRNMLSQPQFAYANVPYKIKPFSALLQDPKNTVDFDETLALEIEQRVEKFGADGKLILNANGDVYQVTLLEKLLVPLLSKLGNFVFGGGIWLNTQRPEWNDANNALVGQGLSMVTLYYMRRYVEFLSQLLADDTSNVEITAEVNEWLVTTMEVFATHAANIDSDSLSDADNYRFFADLGNAASHYREVVYARGHLGQTATMSVASTRDFLRQVLVAIDRSIAVNKREDGLYNAYNLLTTSNRRIEIAELYPMLEGQVAALSTGNMTATAAIDVIESLFASDVYRPDQDSFMLYPDRKLPSFLQKNCIPKDAVMAIPLLQKMLQTGDERIVSLDKRGTYRFAAGMINVGELNDVLETLDNVDPVEINAAREPLRNLYESVFNHKAFTGRSGGMFGFEGLGSIYWHMVSKLLLAVQENYFWAKRDNADADQVARLAELYYRVRRGIGFNKTPAEYGAFPTDPYSHTPKHVGARQPGMTGQVKEEIVTRFGELGIRVSNGCTHFEPSLLRRREFAADEHVFRFLDVEDRWQKTTVPGDGLAFTWCQVPVIYSLDEDSNTGIELQLEDATVFKIDGLLLTEEHSENIFGRNGRIRKITVRLTKAEINLA